MKKLLSLVLIMAGIILLVFFTIGCVKNFNEFSHQSNSLAYKAGYAFVYILLFFIALAFIVTGFRLIRKLRS